jgi:hypothetical protein
VAEESVEDYTDRKASICGLRVPIDAKRLNDEK